LCPRKKMSMRRINELYLVVRHLADGQPIVPGRFSGELLLVVGRTHTPICWDFFTSPTRTKAYARYARLSPPFVHSRWVVIQSRITTLPSSASCLKLAGSVASAHAEIPIVLSFSGGRRSTLTASPFPQRNVWSIRLKPAIGPVPRRPRIDNLKKQRHSQLPLL